MHTFLAYSHNLFRGVPCSSVKHLQCRQQPFQNIPACWYLHACQPTFTIQALYLGLAVGFYQYRSVKIRNPFLIQAGIWGQCSKVPIFSKTMTRMFLCDCIGGKGYGSLLAGKDDVNTTSSICVWTRVVDIILQTLLSLSQLLRPRIGILLQLMLLQKIVSGTITCTSLKTLIPKKMRHCVKHK